jgi:nucleotide-binding universal stress UspA family protein
MLAVRRILVPIELTVGARRALELAAEVALRFDAGIDVVHVWNRPLPLPTARGPKRAGAEVAAPAGAARAARAPYDEAVGDASAETDLDRAAYDDERNAAARCLDDLVRSAIPRAVPPTRCMLEQGAPAEVILGLCETGRYELVVMATRGRSGLAHLLLGSVTERVMRASPIPVLTLGPSVGLGAEQAA